MVFEPYNTHIEHITCIYSYKLTAVIPSQTVQKSSNQTKDELRMQKFYCSNKFGAISHDLYRVVHEVGYVTTTDLSCLNETLDSLKIF